MSKWVLVFLCCFASNAFASSADSGRCPWKIPFTISISATGVLKTFADQRTPEPGSWIDVDTNYETSGSTDFFEVIVDTTSAYLSDSVQYSSNSDVLSFYTSRSFPRIGGPTAISLTIEFAPGSDSIIYVNASASYSWGDYGGSGSTEQYNFQVSSLLFDDTSIFTADSSYRDHYISFTDYSDDTEYYGSPYDLEYETENFAASSVDLSGIFRPMHFADQPPAIVIQSTAQSEPLSVTFLNGALQCSFGASSDDRTLDIFSVLGVKAASCDVTPGQTEVFMPHISPGFYFVRLGSSLAKVYVGE